MRHLGIGLLALIAFCLLGDVGWAQAPAADASRWPIVDAAWPADRGAGNYFSVFKLVLPLLVFFCWLMSTDWLSQDCQRLKLGWQRWNAIVVGTFLGCYILHWTLLSALGSWSFYIAFPVVLLGYLGPTLQYVKKRNASTTAEDRVLTKPHIRNWVASHLKIFGVKGASESESANLPLEINAQGYANPGEDRATSIRMQTAKGFDPLRKLLIDAHGKRAATVVLDYTQQAVAAKYQIDGVLHDAPGRDRITGDALLEVLKTAANLNPAERVKRQSGQFEIKIEKSRLPVKLTSQGTPTGERVVIQVEDGAPHKARLENIGMRQKMQDDLKELLARKAGFVVVSTPPGRGLTSLFTAVTAAVDRFMRSAVNVESAKTNEMKVENVVPHRFDPDKNETPATILPAVIRQYPDIFVVPDLVDGQTAQILCSEVTDEERLVIAAIPAKEASEALLRVLMLKVPIKAFAPVVSAAVSGRLVRKLCNDCKQAYTPPPQLLQQLKLPADKVTQLYRQYQAPPLEPGKKPLPPCATCSGIGYHGRTGIYELLIVNDDVRAALLKQPSLETVREAAKKAGMHNLQEEAIMLVVQGVTSLEEIMRVLKEKE